MLGSEAEEGSAMLLAGLRQEIVQTGINCLSLGIVHGTAGNFSRRCSETGLIAISPSGIPYPEMSDGDCVVVTPDGKIRDGARRPSSETPMHTMIYRARPDVHAIVHTHSHYATVVSCIRVELPVILTEVAVVLGGAVPVSRYGKTATDDIGQSVVEVLTPTTRAVLLKNHGLITLGNSFAESMAIAEIVEESAKVYVHALAANGGREPGLVPAELIPEMRERFLLSYGQVIRAQE
jgi:L-ribulose-5-phosphate 4-epimerase